MSDQKQLLNHILKEYRAGKLKVPGLPEVATKIQAAIRDSRSSASQIAKIIQLDPALTARLIQVANSPFYRGSAKVEDCRAAVSRMGHQTTKSIVTSFSVQQVFQSDSAIVRDLLRGIWRRSSHVAAISFVLARLTPDIMPDRAMLAGLVHEIGALPILRYVENYPELQKNRQMLGVMVDKIGGKLGHMVLKSWAFDDELSGIPEQLNNWDYAPEKEPNYTDVVIVARVHDHMDSGIEDDKFPPLSEIASYNKMSVSKLGPDASQELLYEAKEDIDNLMGMLGSPG